MKLQGISEPVNIDTLEDEMLLRNKHFMQTIWRSNAPRIADLKSICQKADLRIQDAVVEDKLRSRSSKLTAAEIVK